MYKRTGPYLPTNSFILEFQPGVFFDINPRGLKEVDRSSCIGNMRFSYGPPMENLVEGMKQIKAMVKYWELHQESCDSYADREL